jgi:DNA polymerase elongation subunit (family B)
MTDEKVIFRQNEKVKITTDKSFKFQIIDWYCSDEKPPEYDDGSEEETEDERSEDDEEYKKPKYKVREFTAHLFGVSANSRSVYARLRGFKPYFFIKIPQNWGIANVEIFMTTIKKIIGKDYHIRSLYNYEIVSRIEFYGYTGKQKKNFLKLTFLNKIAFNKFKKLFEEPILYNGKKVKFPLYEAKLDPFLRLIHELEIEPTGWISVKKDFRIPSFKHSKCQIEIETDYKNVCKIESENIAPVLIASFDIEAMSSHGDFPQAKKDYKKLAIELINKYWKDLTLIKKIPILKDKLDVKNLPKYFENLISKSFNQEKNDDDISFIYTKKSEKPSIDIIEVISHEIAKICNRPRGKMKADTKIKIAVKKIIKQWDGIKNIEDLENIITNVSKSSKIARNILSECVFKKDILVSLVNNLLTLHLPPVEGDQATQIATVVWKYGQQGIYYKHIITLGTCDPIEGVEVESVDNEKDLLIKWCKFINRLDPDILTGYNIFGFDYPFLYHRAEELGCVEDFNKLSRLRDYQSVLIEKELSSSALGDNTFYYIDMVGRVQIDLLKVIQRDHRLGSYKLDNVAENFISGKISFIGTKEEENNYKLYCQNVKEQLEKDKNLNKITEDDYVKQLSRMTNLKKYLQENNNNQEWIKIDNTQEIENKNYITITKTKDGDRFNNGNKIQILDKNVNDNSFIKVNMPINPDIIDKSPIWGLAKDDVDHKDIFRLQKGSSSDRRIIAVYCIQDCVLCIRLMKKLEIIANNIGMSNVTLVPFSYIFLRGQGIKIFSLVAKECASQGYLIKTLSNNSNDTNIEDNNDDNNITDTKSKIKHLIKELNKELDDDTDEDNTPTINPQSSNFRRGNDDDGTYGFGFSEDTQDNSIGIEEGDGYEGAIVLPPKPDIYLEDPISVMDYSSLYPSSMISENLSHDTYIMDEKYVKDLPPDHYILSVVYEIKKWIDPNKKSLGKETIGEKTCRFVQFPPDKDGKPQKGIIPIILQKLLFARRVYKDKAEKESDPFKASVWDGLQLAYKVTANSLYGQIGAPTSSIYLKDVAACTTATGRKLLCFARDFVERNFEGAKVIYGDTDSIFVKFKLVDKNGRQLRGIEALQQSINYGLEVDSKIRRYMKPPHKLAYEKTFYPFILFTKKRYVGNLYETDVKKYKQKSMGIVLKRRDNAPIVKYIYGGIINKIINERSIDSSIEFLQTSLQDLINRKFDNQMLMISKTLKADYKDPDSIAHKVLADRMAERDPGNKPQSNDRIPYIYIDLPLLPKGQKYLQGNKIEHIDYVNQNNLLPDFLFYITNQIMKPTSQIYELIVSKLKGFNKGDTYFEDMEHNLKIKGLEKDKIKDKINKAKALAVKKLLFDNIINSRYNQKAGNQEITNYIKINDNHNNDNRNNDNKNQDEYQENKKKSTSILHRNKKLNNKSILSFL